MTLFNIRRLLCAVLAAILLISAYCSALSESGNPFDDPAVDSGNPFDDPASGTADPITDGVKPSATAATPQGAPRGHSG